MSRRHAIAIVANEQTPYRLHLHRRITAELPGIELWSLFTHELATSPWKHDDCPEIRPVLFGKGDSVASQGALSTFPREWRKGGEMIRWLIDHNIRLVILYGYNDAARLRLISWCHRQGIPCYLFGDSNIRGDHAAGLRLAIKKVYLGWVLRRVSGVLHCGRLGREYFLRYGASPDRLFPFPYEPDYNLLANPDPGITDSLATRFGFVSSRKRFLFVGRLVPVKRAHLLLQSFLEIADRCPDWDLVIAGDGPLRSSLEALADLRPGRITFTGFLSDPAEVAALYANCHVFVLPSSYEPWGVVLTEAAAAGLTLIASDAVGAAADVVCEGDNGWVFESSGQALPTMLERASNRNVSLEKLSFHNWRHSSDPIRVLTDIAEQHTLSQPRLLIISP